MHLEIGGNVSKPVMVEVNFYMEGNSRHRVLLGGKGTGK